MPAASVLGALDYLRQALGGDYAEKLPEYRRLLARLNGAGGSFASLSAEAAEKAVRYLEREEPSGFAMLRQHVLEGCFCDPGHGGNLNRAGWAAAKLIPHQH